MASIPCTIANLPVTMWSTSVRQSNIASLGISHAGYLAAKVVPETEDLR